MLDKTQERFLKYHTANPHICKLFVDYAKQMKAAGKNKYSIWAIANRVRWHYDLVINSADEFKISNDLLSRYARHIMAQEPDLAGFFATKPLKYTATTAAA